MWLGITSSPVIVVLSCLVVLAVILKAFRAIRWLPLTAAPRDPLRRFAGVERATIMTRAGGRCEFHGLVGGRCRQTEKLHADHVHPHSRGGSTSVANGQALCSRHNKQKAARIPLEWELRRIEKRRRAYFPDGVSTAVVRRPR
ncbi:MAG: hypothetical protein QOE71_1748 [Pseudonocardiales bacterium]|jgi:5-methylcytosine-specific restriction endonuclease McrA|nr:hypothetical protein [Pseudonocardiales bacterium]